MDWESTQWQDQVVFLEVTSESPGLPCRSEAQSVQEEGACMSVSRLECMASVADPATHCENCWGSGDGDFPPTTWNQEVVQPQELQAQGPALVNSGWGWGGAEGQEGALFI